MTVRVKIHAAQSPWIRFGMGLLIAVVISGLLFLTFGRSRFTANKAQEEEASAIHAMSALYQAQIQYRTSFPASGFACSLSALGGNSGPPSAQAAQLLPPDLAGGHKSGYIFDIVNCVKNRENQGDAVVSFDITAVPQPGNERGHPAFCMDQSGQITLNPVGGPPCVQPRQ